MHGACNNRVQLAGRLALTAAPESCNVSWTKAASKLFTGAKCLCRLCSENQQTSSYASEKEQELFFSFHSGIQRSCASADMTFLTKSPHPKVLSCAGHLDGMSSVAQGLDDVSSVAQSIWMACPQLRRSFRWHVLSCTGALDLSWSDKLDELCLHVLDPLAWDSGSR